jgi:hypothetical protein
MSDTTAPEFVFEMRAVDRSTDSYYVTRWDRAVPVEVVAATKQEAINRADAMLGSAGSHRYWVFRVDKVRDVRASDEKVGAA